VRRSAERAVDHGQAAGVDFGTLTVTFNPDKTIQGTYTPDFGSPMCVSGRVMAEARLSLEIGSRHFTGMFTPRGILGTRVSVRSSR
jgi:hypothetical protein